MKRKTQFLDSILGVFIVLCGCSAPAEQEQPNYEAIATPVIIRTESPTPVLGLNAIPEFNGISYIEVNSNIPYFNSDEKTTEPFEHYSPLDRLGRCGVAYANVGIETMPTEPRGKIGQIKPAGWHTVKYDFIDGMYLYNRCHLIGYQLTAENDNTLNLITGTRYLNVEGMLQFENKVADYVNETGNHVLYRATPIYDKDNLIASGVEIEAESVEDNGAGVEFNIYCYNVQPGVVIDYATGESNAIDVTITENLTDDAVTATYILNINTKKFHYPECPSVKIMTEKNKREFTGNREDAIKKGYSPCGRCNP